MNKKRDLMEETIQKMLEEMDDVEIGTKEHVLAAASVEKLCRAINEEDRAELDYDGKLRESEARVKQIECDKRKLSLDTIVKCGTVTVLTVGCLIFEAKGHILPKMKFIDKIKIF